MRYIVPLLEKSLRMNIMIYYLEIKYLISQFWATSAGDISFLSFKNIAVHAATSNARRTASIVTSAAAANTAHHASDPARITRRPTRKEKAFSRFVIVPASIHGGLIECSPPAVFLSTVSSCFQSVYPLSISRI